jgi:hypothetical protein
MIIVRHLGFLALIAAFLFEGAGCKSQQFASQWRDRDIIIDGNTAEWNGLMQAPENAEVAIGAVNDDAFLYLCLTSENRETALRILMSGFTVLFENKAKKESRLGIHFPLALAGAPMPFERNGNSEHDPAPMKKRLEGSLGTLALIGPGKNDTLPMAVRMAESLGIAVSLKPLTQGFTYEIKMPLNSDPHFTYAINMGKDSLVKVTLTSDEAGRSSDGISDHGERMDDGGVGAGAGGGLSGPGGRMSSRGGGLHGSRRQSGMSEQFKMEFSLCLAKKNQKGAVAP